MKKILIAISIGLLACSAAFCAPDKEAKERTIVWVNPLTGHPVYLMQEEAFGWAAKDYGFKPISVGPSQIDAENMVREIENAIAQKVDGIITVPFNWSAFQSVYDQAKKAGIPIVNTGADTPAEWRLAFIGTDNKAFGRDAARILIEKKKGKANICIMMSQLDIQNQVEQKQAFEEALKASPDMKVTVVEADKADMSLAVQKFEEVFKAYPQIDTVWMLEATGGVAAAKVAAEMGIANSITILAIDDVQQTVDEIRKGRIWGTLAQNFYRMGYEAAGFIMAHYAHQEVPASTDSKTTLVTQENVESYKKEMIASVKKKNP